MYKRCKWRGRNRSFRGSILGVTLTELLTVIAISAILMSIGVPSYRYVTTTNRIASEVNGLLGDMQYARVEAIKQGVPVTVCVSADGASCLNSTSWHGGWIVFADPNNNQTVDGGETVLRVQSAFVGGDTFQSSNDASAVTFNREGFASNIVNGTLITLHADTPNSASTRCLSVTLVGQTTVQTYGGTCT